MNEKNEFYKIIKEHLLFYFDKDQNCFSKEFVEDLIMLTGGFDENFKLSIKLEFIKLLKFKIIEPTMIVDSVDEFDNRIRKRLFKVC